MSITNVSVRTLTYSTVFENGRNTGASDIAEGYLITLDTSTVDGIALATSPSVVPAGVASETIPGTSASSADSTKPLSIDNKLSRSYQVGGKAMCVCGAAVAIGDKITCDSSGRGITAGAGQNVWGVAVTATTAANQQFELRPLRGSLAQTGGMLQCVETVITAALVAANTNKGTGVSTLSPLATLPQYAFVLHSEVITGTAFTDGSAGTATLDVGYSGAQTAFVSGANVSSVATIGPTAVAKSMEASTPVTVRVNSTVNGSTLTAGSVTVRLFYYVPGRTVVTPAFP